MEEKTAKKAKRKTKAAAEVKEVKKAKKKITSAKESGMIKKLKPAALKGVKRLEKEDKILLGVSKNISDRTGTSILIVRLVMLALILSVVGIPLYLLAAIFLKPVPKKKKRSWL